MQILPVLMYCVLRHLFKKKTLLHKNIKLAKINAISKNSRHSTVTILAHTQHSAAKTIGFFAPLRVKISVSLSTFNIY